MREKLFRAWDDEQKNMAYQGTLDLERADFYQEFFNFFNKEYALTLTIQEMDDIRHECRKLERRLGN